MIVSNLYDEGNANIPVHKKATRPRKEIFPGYERLVQKRSQRAGLDDEEVPDENCEVQEKVDNICLYLIKGALYRLTFCIFFQAFTFYI